MSAQERVEQLVENVRAVWGLCSALVLVLLLVYAPWWTVFPALVLIIGSYFTVLLVTAIAVANTQLGQELLEEVHASKAANIVAQQEATLEEAADAGLHIGSVTDYSEPIGRMWDRDIHDWVEVVGPDMVSRRYFFSHALPHTSWGQPMLDLANLDDESVCLDGFVYRLQPE